MEEEEEEEEKEEEEVDTVRFLIRFANNSGGYLCASIRYVNEYFALFSVTRFQCKIPKKNKR